MIFEIIILREKLLHYKMIQRGNYEIIKLINKVID